MEIRKQQKTLVKWLFVIIECKGYDQGITVLETGLSHYLFLAIQCVACVSEISPRKENNTFSSMPDDSLKTDLPENTFKASSTAISSFITNL